MQDPRERALHYIKQYGPVLPIQIAKELGTNIIMAGAILSELAANKSIKITTVKRGGSPFYYIPGQEQKLQNLMQYLPEREREAYNLLNEKKVVKDKEAGPVMRVALRAIKDYAIPITVTSQDGEELFWKWYLSNEEDVKNKVESMLVKETPEVKEEAQIKKEEPKLPLPDKKPEQIKEKPEPKKIKKLVEKTNFDALLREYLTNHNITIITEGQSRKNKEYSFIAKIPSQIGKLDFYVKVKNKKTITPTDLSLAHSEGQIKKLPVVIISNGMLTKKAKENITKELRGQVFFRSL